MRAFAVRHMSAICAPYVRLGCLLCDKQFDENHHMGRFKNIKKASPHHRHLSTTTATTTTTTTTTITATGGAAAPRRKRRGG